jgi:hydroxyacylglutathione hydrolase
VLPYDKPILLVLQHHEHLDRVARNLTRIGYDNLSGYLTPSIASWYKAALPIERLDMITAVELNERLSRDDGGLVLDVRSRDEWNNGDIEDSLNIYVGLLEKRVDDLPEKKQITVVCESGTRSSLACSILLKAGRKNVSNMLGGMGAWRKLGYPVAVAK